MVIIECNSTAEKYFVLPGLYKLNSAIAEGVMMCEENVMRHEGIVEIDEDTPFKEYRYVLNDDAVYNAYYMECKLPNTKYKNCWESIVYNESVKFSIFNSVSKMLDCRSNADLSRLFAVNGAVLLHGPPGTGKTTLARAVAQKISIRKPGQFKMREINCASIFSKFYGESLQILSKMFAETDDSIIYMVDEIESLISHRSSTLHKNEPNDSLRLVNLFLSILDRQRGIFIFTSNYPDALDRAFLDRCDIKIEVGLPRAADRYNIIKNILAEMMCASILTYHVFDDYDDGSSDVLSSKLRHLSMNLHGYSGRQLKKAIFEVADLEGGSVEKLINDFQMAVDSKENR